MLEGGSLWVMQIKPFWSGKPEHQDVFTLGLLVQMAGVQFSWRACKKTGMFRGKPESIVGRRMGGGGQARAEKFCISASGIGRELGSVPCIWRWLLLHYFLCRVGAACLLKQRRVQGTRGKCIEQVLTGAETQPTSRPMLMTPVYFSVTWLSEMFRRVCQGRCHFQNSF